MRATRRPAAPVPEPSSHTLVGRQPSSSPSAAATRTHSAIADGDTARGSDDHDDVFGAMRSSSSGFERWVESGTTCAALAHAPTSAATASAPRTPR